MKLRKKYLLFLLFCTQGILYCQEKATLISFPSLGNSMHYEDIWNLTIIINSPEASSFYFLEIEVEEEPGKTLWKAKTYTFRIPSSPFSIFPTNIVDFEPVNVNFLQPEWYEKMTLGGGLFPPGKYKITYRLIQTTEGCTTAGSFLAFTVVYKTITSLFPPTLLFPFNNDTMDVETPVFAWSPVLPIQKTGINYSLKIAEISGNQNTSQALINNNPYLIYDAGNDLSIPYPPLNMPLRTGGNYAWQVIASTREGVLSYSEPWRFSIREKNKPDTVSFSNRVFLTVKNELTGPDYQVKGNFLFFRYFEPYADSDGGLMYSLSSTVDNETILSGKIFPLAEQKGLNSYAFDISTLKNGHYLLSITDEKGNKGFVAFNRIIEKK